MLITTLAGIVTPRLASPNRVTRRIAEVATTGDVNWEMSVTAVAGIRSIWRFAAFIASWHRITRSSGSAQFVGSSAMMLDTRFVQGSSSSPVRIDTGTIARNGLSGSASWWSRYSRSAPAQIAITMSLTVQPVAVFSALMFSSEVERIAKRRCGEIARFHGVAGAGEIGRLTRDT